MLNILNQPKAELHIHLEGSLEPEMMLHLAKRNNLTLKYSSIDAIRNAYHFNNLQEFLDLYYQGMSVLKTEQDYFDLTYAYLTKAQQDHVTHAEMFMDPQAHLSRGIALNTIFDGITCAITQARQEYGIQASLIVCFLRHLSENDALKTFDQLMPFRHQFIGIGLDSSEQGNPPSKFKNLFDRARAEKLKLVAHAGEEGATDYVWEALDILGVDRIDHGNVISTDKALIQRVVADKIALTMCPLSNRSLQVAKDLRQHPAMLLLNKGVRVTINSDDPAYFGGYVNQNYQALAEALSLTAQDLEKLIHMSLAAKFV